MVFLMPSPPFLRIPALSADFPASFLSGKARGLDFFFLSNMDTEHIAFLALT